MMCLNNSERSCSKFDEQLAFGAVGEKLVAQWLKERGNFILPVREDLAKPFRGPRIEGNSEEIVSPDILIVSKQFCLCWIEVKAKDHFTFYRRTRTWQTGFDKNKLTEYQAAASRCNWPCWLFFLHRTTHPSAADLRRGAGRWCPSGLFAQELNRLAATIDHEGEPEEWAPHGMLFWNADDLVQLASAEEFGAEKKKIMDVLFDDDVIPGFE